MSIPWWFDTAADLKKLKRLIAAVALVSANSFSALGGSRTPNLLIRRSTQGGYRGCPPGPLIVRELAFRGRPCDRYGPPESGFLSVCFSICFSRSMAK
ncbi:hypothetical protein BH24ACT5_BH24ACT5_00390 [soil metagenome]